LRAVYPPFKTKFFRAFTMAEAGGPFATVHVRAYLYHRSYIVSKHGPLLHRDIVYNS